MATVTYYPKNSLQSFTVPNGVTTLHVECAGSKGANNSATGGNGIKVECDLRVTSGQLLNIMVGDIPNDKSTASYNASDIRINGINYIDRVIVAGGGGSASTSSGGNAGSTQGEDGGTSAIAKLNAAKGGTQSAGGSKGTVQHLVSSDGSNGVDGTLGLGGNGSSGGGGAGGAGYYGGGGGATVKNKSGGGGGGSSYVDTTLCSNISYTSNTNRGFVNISYEKGSGSGIRYNQLYRGSQHVAYIRINGKTVRKVYKGSDLIYILGFDPVIFYPKSSLQTFNIPNGIPKIHVECVGSKGCSGSGVGGAGGKIECDLNVIGKQKLYIAVGDIPSTYSTPSYNASDIRTVNSDNMLDIDSLNSRLVVAGGGGSGAQSYSSGYGGFGGGEIAGDGGQTGNQQGGHGGTQLAGGAGGESSGIEPSPGNPGIFGLGGKGIWRNSWSGAGGAGWYGGGAGAAARQHKGYYPCAGGGGGSSYTDSALCSNVTHTQGINDSSGYVIISTPE